VDRHVRHLESYYLQKQELLLQYPLVLTLEHVDSIIDIRDWISDSHLDCKWHAFLFRNFGFEIGYDFFFRQSGDAAMFKLAWGGLKENRLAPLRFGFFLGEQWIP
jgi:hypothetical protein